jgi:AcrR family transcriptional regulator
MQAKSGRTRDRILKAAAHLFYLEGIRAPSVDAIAARAEVTKRTLYYHFASKDELIAAYLAERDLPNLKAFAAWFSEAKGALPDKVEALFVHIGKAARHPKWKGCGFLRTASELANLPGHPARKIGAAHKKKVEQWLAEELAGGGIGEAETLACQIALLLDGAFSAMLVHGDAKYAGLAGKAARTLVSAALPCRRMTA